MIITPYGKAYPSPIIDLDTDPTVSLTPPLPPAYQLPPQGGSPAPAVVVANG